MHFEQKDDIFVSNVMIEEAYFIFPKFSVFHFCRYSKKRVVPNNSILKI